MRELLDACMPAEQPPSWRPQLALSVRTRADGVQWENITVEQYVQAMQQGTRPYYAARIPLQADDALHFIGTEVPPPKHLPYAVRAPTPALHRASCLEAGTIEQRINST